MGLRLLSLMSHVSSSTQILPGLYIFIYTRGVETFRSFTQLLKDPNEVVPRLNHTCSVPGPLDLLGGYRPTPLFGYQVGI